MTPEQQKELERKNKRILSYAFLFVFFMVGMAYASVPLYDLFCRVTGFGGTTGTSVELPERVLDRTVTVRFNASTARNMPWEFRPQDTAIEVKLGQGGLTSYVARNRSTQAVAGTAIYNVTPQKAGRYFKKIQCFCFDKQWLNPNESMDMPVYFYVDPAMADDPMMDDVKTITLSYTFFQSESHELDNALEDYYNQN